MSQVGLKIFKLMPFCNLIFPSVQYNFSVVTLEKFTNIILSRTNGENHMSLLPFPKLMSLMLEAYPCTHFYSQGKASMNMASNVSFNTYPEAIWYPKNGNIPRGFLGATGKVKEVEVIMVFAEPSEPYGNESYGSNLDPKSLMDACINHTYTSM